jgi:hypothetical protein
MSDKRVSNLRRRMIADMTTLTFSEKTQRDYIRHIEAFARFPAPDTATGDDMRRCQLAQVEWGAQPPKMNPGTSAPALASPRLRASDGSRQESYLFESMSQFD